MIMEIKTKKLGQYFTTNEELKKIIYKYIKNNPKNILEPCIGKGHLIEYISKINKSITFDMFEIDKELELLENINKQDVIMENFIDYDIQKKYNTIIGNPPYIKTKKGNVYLDFVEKCFNLLEENGELIFIVPSNFFKLTSASKLLNDMMEIGSFTDIYHPHSERLFKEARIDVLIFRYYKNNKIDKKCMYNNKLLNICNKNGLITFYKDEIKENSLHFEDLFDIYVGIVSGKDCVYKNKNLGNIKVLEKENKKESYICITEFPCKNQEINDYLLKNKDILINRKIRKFNENNWFEWGALRNISQMICKKNDSKECIYIYRLTRNENIAFKGKVTIFGSLLMMLKPKPKVKVNLDNIINYLNSNEFKKNFVYSGRFKIGQRQLKNCFIPNKLM